MLWLRILCVAAAILLIIGLLRIQLRVDFGQQITAEARVGPFRVWRYPAAKKKKNEPNEEKQSEPTEKKTGGKSRAIPKPGREDLKEAYQTLKPVLLRALGRTRRGIRIHPLEISVVFGGSEDPARAAESYGYAQAALWTVMPMLEQLLVIPDPAIHMEVDFDTDTTQIRGKAGLGIRIGTALVLVLGMAIPTLRWFMKYLKRKKTTADKQPAQSTAA